MKPLVHHVLLALMLLSLTLFASVALANTNATAGAASLSAYWAQLVILACVGVAYALRKFAPQGHFFHTDLGAWLLSGAVLALGAVAGGVQAHGLSGLVVVQALIGAGMTALGLSNPGVVSGTTSPMAMKKQAGSARVGLVLALALVGCAGWTVWKACELGQLPQISQTVIPTIVTDLSGVDSATAISQVESVGGGLLPAQISCIVKAIAADVAIKAAAVKGQLSPVEENIMRNGGDYLKKHPALACGEPPARKAGEIERAVRGQVIAGVPPVRL